MGKKQKYLLIFFMLFTLACFAALFLNEFLAAKNYSAQIPTDAILPNKTYPEKIILPLDFFKQDKTGCSRTAFAMVMHYYNNSIMLDEITKRASRSPDNGSPNALLLTLAEEHGFKTRAYPGSIEDIIHNIANGRPLIVAQYPSASNLGQNHDRVVVGYDRAKKELIVHDPAAGANISYSYNDFLNLWVADFVSKPGGGLEDEKHYSVLLYPVANEPEPKILRNIKIDGYAADWLGMKSFSPDRENDCNSNNSKTNIKRMYLYKDNSYIYLMAVFTDKPEYNRNVNYFFDFYYDVNTVPYVKRFNFNYQHEPCGQIDEMKCAKLKNSKWALGTVFEAKIGLENFADLPDYVSIRAGTFDIAGNKTIDLSYANAYNLKEDG